MAIKPEQEMGKVKEIIISSGEFRHWTWTGSVSGLRGPKNIPALCFVFF